MAHETEFIESAMDFVVCLFTWFEIVIVNDIEI